MKCECRKRHRFTFQRPTATVSSSGAVSEAFTTAFTEYGYLEAKGPFDLVQSEKVIGQLFYMLELRWNANTETITPEYRVLIPTLNNITLQVIGPISPLKGDRRHGLIKCMQSSPVLI